MALAIKTPCSQLCSSRRMPCAARPRLSVHSRRLLVSSTSQSGLSTTSTSDEPRVASVQVDLGAVIEQVTVALTDPNSRLVQAQMQFPLGLVLENVAGEVVVTEVAEGGSAAAADCRVGDVVRATTAMTMQMTYPTMNVLFGGVGRPKLVKMLLPTSKAPFAKVMDAVRSNSVPVGGDGSITLILERCEPAGRSNSSGASSGASNGTSSESSSSAAAGVGGVGEQSRDRELVTAGVGGGTASHSEGDGGAVFDPKIFE